MVLFSQEQSPRKLWVVTWVTLCVALKPVVRYVPMGCAVVPLVIVELRKSIAVQAVRSNAMVVGQDARMEMALVDFYGKEQQGHARITTTA